MWQQIWFLCNTIFVALFIFLLFSHRNVQMGRLEQNDEQVKRALVIRNVVIVLTVIAFLAMCASFIMNMHEG